MSMYVCMYVCIHILYTRSCRLSDMYVCMVWYERNVCKCKRTCVYARSPLAPTPT